MDISTFELRQRIHPDYLTISGWENPDFWCLNGILAEGRKDWDTGWIGDFSDLKADIRDSLQQLRIAHECFSEIEWDAVEKLLVEGVDFINAIKRAGWEPIPF
jgi:hypothetical protein